MHDDAVDLASDVALQGADRFELGMAFGNAARNIGLGSVIRSQASDSDDVQGTVRGPVPAPVQAVPDGLPRRGRDRADAAECREAGFRFQTLGIVACGKKQLACAVLTDRIRAKSSGASSLTMAPIITSRSAISSCSSRYRRARDFKLIR